MINIPLTKKAYVAGIFDGEGSVSLRKNKRKNRKHCSYFIDVAIWNSSEELINEVKSLYGGFKSTRIDKKGRRKVYYAWRAASNIAMSFLRDVYPFLIVKKERAEIAMEFQDMIQREKQSRSKKSLSDQELEERERFYQKLKSLNR